MAFTELKEGQEIPREYLMHLINATPSAAQPTWVVLGDDLEDYEMEASANVETTKNILGQTKTRVTDYEVTDSADTFYAKKDNPLFALLEDIFRGRKVLDDCRTQILTVYIYKGSASPYEADMESCVLEVKKFGGDTKGVNIPFDVHRENDVVKGTYDTAKKTFTPDSQ